ncbi:MAG TPA: ATP-binding protein [Terriglobales bacterium]
MVRFERLLVEISTRFINLTPDELDGAIEDAQQAICQELGISQSILWQPLDNDPGNFMITHYYRESKPPEVSGPLRADEYFPWMLQRVIEKNVVYMRSVNELPPEAARDAEAFRHYGTKSTLILPLYVAGDPLIGVLSFASLDEEREYSEALRSRLEVLAQIFANALARQGKELRLRESEARLNLATRSAGAGLWTMDLSTKRLWLAETTHSILGLPSSASIDYQQFLQMVHPEERGLVQAAVDRALSTGEEQGVEYRIIRQDGQVRWLSSRGHTHAEASAAPYLLMGVTVDVTEARRAEERVRVLSTRLITAQEEERRRIARELHDDISQSLALLVIKLMRADQPVSGKPGKRHAGVVELCAELREVATRVSRMSHALHSAKLEYLGLEFAVQSHCRQFSEQHRIVVMCECKDVPAKMDSFLALSLLRIVQEALHNVAKHSQAKSAKVNLQASGSELALSIKDDGQGFDPQQAQLSEGLGLISMRERVHLAGGKFALSSVPGKGTSISVDVPLVNSSAQS